MNCDLTFGYSILRVFKHSMNITSKWISSRLFKSNHSPLTTCSYNKILNLNERDNVKNLLKALPFVRINGHYESTEWYSISPFPKVHIGPLHFYKRPALVFAFADWKKPPKNFHFYEERHYNAKVSLLWKWSYLTLQKVGDSLAFCHFGLRNVYRCVVLFG